MSALKFLPLVLALGLGALAQTPPTRLSLDPPARSAVAGQPLELALGTDARFGNPFDPAQADVQVRFTSPTGESVNVPAFWFQDFDPATLEPRGTPGWRVRFTPTVPGAWTAQATLGQAKPSSQAQSFKVGTAQPGTHGFIRVNPKNPRYFAYGDGTFYLPIGQNIAWSNAKGGAAVLADYTRWLDRLGQNGGNVARVWMAAWSFGVEWKDTGLGDYRARERQAWLLDRVFDLAAARGINIELTLINHGQFSTSTNPEWADNPYNAANGGPLKTPDAFVTDPTAKALFKRRLRYLAARYAARPNLFAWEWWNEVNWTPIGDTELKPWIAEMTGALKAWDPYRHLISSSYATGGTSDLWKLPEISFSQQHDYSGRDLLTWGRSNVSAFTDTAPRKPVLLAELGYSAGGNEPPVVRDRIHFHNGLWAAPFTGYAGTAMYWWWDTLTDPDNLWPQYRGLSDFLRGEDLSGLKSGDAVVNRPADASALTLQGPTRALVWLRSSAYDASAANDAYQKALIRLKAGPTWTYPLPIRQAVTLRVQGLTDGLYTAHWYAPQKNVWLTVVPVRVQGGSVTLKAPSFDKDLAVKLVPAGQPRTP